MKHELEIGKAYRTVNGGTVVVVEKCADGDYKVAAVYDPEDPDQPDYLKYFYSLEGECYGVPRLDVVWPDTDQSAPDQSAPDTAQREWWSEHPEYSSKTGPTKCATVKRGEDIGTGCAPFTNLNKETDIMSTDKQAKPTTPDVIVLVEGGCVQSIKASRQDLNVYVLDLDDRLDEEDPNDPDIADDLAFRAEMQAAYDALPCYVW